MPVYRLDPKDIAFPMPHLAEPSGLLAIGGDLRPERLVFAYQHGIFPWFEDEGMFYWYSPDPRCVLFPDELKVHKSMRSIFNQEKFRYTFDAAFTTVMEYCAQTPRHHESGTWIGSAFIEGYSQLHQMGIAHSVEVWDGNELVGGLYGIAIGKVFFGESMFSLRPNASKAGFIQLVRALTNEGFQLIDCQQETNHLLSLGARNIPRETFMDYLSNNRYHRTLVGQWEFGQQGQLLCQPLPATNAQ